MDEPDATYRLKRDIWDDYNHRQEFEHTLIDRKTTWLLATQALLVAGYGVTFDSKNSPEELEEFRNVVAGVGMGISGIVLVGVVFLIVSKLRAWAEYRDYFAEGGTPQLPLGGEKLKWGAGHWNTFLTLLPDVLLPIAFLVGWWVII
jgi:hypothetical protein